MNRLLDYLGITLGALITALGLNFFLIPNAIAAGGASGIATITYHLFNLPPGIVMLAINIPLLILNIIFIGFRFGLYSVLGGIMTSLFVNYTTTVPTLTSDPLLASLYGGLVAGTGIGLVFRFKGSTGGTDLAASLLSHFTRLSVGQGLLLVDGAVIASAGYFFGLELAMYAFIATFVTSRMIDVVQEGFYSTRTAFIVSKKPDEIRREILSKLDRGVTVFYGRGGFGGKEREILLSVIARNEITRLKSIVYDYDPDAFVVITSAHEVLGEGFTPPTN